MAKQKLGKRNRLLLFRSAWNRLWQSMLWTGLLMAGLWVVLAYLAPAVDPFYDMFFFFGGGGVLGFGVLGFLWR